jgi:hypothetical protein
MAVQERPDHLVQAPRRGPVERPERDDALAQLGMGADAGGRLLQRLQRAERMLGEGLAGAGRDDAATGADEERRAERALQPADLVGDRGLGDVQRLGGGGERPELGRRAEAAQLLKR